MDTRVVNMMIYSSGIGALVLQDLKEHRPICGDLRIFDLFFSVVKYVHEEESRFYINVDFREGGFYGIMAMVYPEAQLVKEVKEYIVDIFEELPLRQHHVHVIEQIVESMAERTEQ